MQIAGLVEFSARQVREEKSDLEAEEELMEAAQVYLSGVKTED